MARYVAAHSASVSRPAAGSTHWPRCMSAFVASRNRRASTLVSKLRLRLRPPGSR
ncbi:MAG TPA: hypothetical protein VJ622_09510 [Acidimicrobiia bacterium]|nr:hypothetical protein [Acidimicrobiia bacterium]